MSKFQNAKISYNYCRICGYTPQTKADEPNYAPLRFWDADDGWIIGTLCRWCVEDGALDAKPEPGDYAYHTTNQICDEECTDEDPSTALNPILSEYIR